MSEATLYVCLIICLMSVHGISSGVNTSFCNEMCPTVACHQCQGSKNPCCMSCCPNSVTSRLRSDFCNEMCTTLDCGSCYGSKNPCCINCCHAQASTTEYRNNNNAGGCSGRK